MYHNEAPNPPELWPSLWKPLLKAGLEDDGWQWDWTAMGTLGAKPRKVRARIVAKSPGVWAASSLCPAAEALSAELGSPIQITTKLKDGAPCKKGDVVCTWTGEARMVLAMERPFLNLASYAGGIATRTRGLVEILDRRWKEVARKGDRKPRVISTRKTLPLYRDIAIHAVQAGGGYAHRVSLSGGILIKENHIAAAGGIAAAIRGARAVAPHLLAVEIEVTNLKELQAALAERAEVVMLDNFEPEEVRAALQVIADGDHHPLIEVSGGISESTLASYVMPGVTVISIGSLTHSVTATDLSLLVE